MILFKILFDSIQFKEILIEWFSILFYFYVFRSRFYKFGFTYFLFVWLLIHPVIIGLNNLWTPICIFFGVHNTYRGTFCFLCPDYLELSKRVSSVHVGWLVTGWVKSGLAQLGSLLCGLTKCQPGLTHHRSMVMPADPLSCFFFFNKTKFIPNNLK